jgi:hypothetical protein
MASTAVTFGGSVEAPLRIMVFVAGALHFHSDAGLIFEV